MLGVEHARASARPGRRPELLAAEGLVADAARTVDRDEDRQGVDGDAPPDVAPRAPRDASDQADDGRAQAGAQRAARRREIALERDRVAAAAGRTSSGKAASRRRPATAATTHLPAPARRRRAGRARRAARIASAGIDRHDVARQLRAREAEEDEDRHAPRRRAGAPAGSPDRAASSRTTLAMPRDSPSQGRMPTSELRDEVPPRRVAVVDASRGSAAKCSWMKKKCANSGLRSETRTNQGAASDQHDQRAAARCGCGARARSRAPSSE